ncbi:MAG: GTPase domain-containing protein [Thiohalocapsa sp.]|uniref:GTPase family protein n=1 Tax=Thiohalocapsa sp. TaxID=2497641 RepID=UPI0025CF5AB7|nr:GTPase domain-containing protein [Thiohalocapsa sp.]MCG6940738.1 GTPase domain-containing protein [Thiohalocapsa sp.]
MTSGSGLLWRQLRRELGALALIGLLILIPWLVGLAAGIWFMAQQGWAWYWWAATVVLLALAFALLRRWPRPRKSAPSPFFDLDPSASAAEQRARQALAQRAAAIAAADLRDPDAASNLIRGAFHDVARAYSPDDPVALWRFTLPELLLMVEDFAQRLRATVLADFPVLRHIELSWVVTLIGLSGPAAKILSLFRILRWIDPSSALAAELRGSVATQALGSVGDGAKAQMGVLLVEQAGETAIKLYSGGYRRRADELLPTAPTPIPDAAPEPLTVLLAGQRNAGKSALLNALLGRAREPVGLLTAPAEDCRAYEFQAEGVGALMLVDCPGTEGTGKAREPWLTQAAQSDLVLWIAAANRADRAADQRALAALDALAEQKANLRPVPRLLVLTHADQLDPPMEWAPPYDIEHGQRGKEQQMREARQAACEQLGMQHRHCVLVAVRPGEPIWNAEALQQAMLDVLPEAHQKQLERGMAKDGWFQRTQDTLGSIPGTSNLLRGTAGQVIRRTLREATRKITGHRA